jgi:septum formation protein
MPRMRKNPLEQPHWTLASASPRRAELLRSIIDSFSIAISPKPEPVRKPTTVDVELWPVCLAHYKAKAVMAARHLSFVSKCPWGVIGADTIVELEGNIINKAQNSAHARRILQSLSGRVHRVITGVAVVTGTQTHFISAIAVCRMRNLSSSFLVRYLASGLWRGKAGAYGIQDNDDPLVQLISGEITTVMGLPVPALRDLLNRMDLKKPS